MIDIPPATYPSLFEMLFVYPVDQIGILINSNCPNGVMKAILLLALANILSSD
jgi:hypothetical protein